MHEQILKACFNAFKVHCSNGVDVRDIDGLEFEVVLASGNVCVVSIDDFDNEGEPEEGTTLIKNTDRLKKYLDPKKFSVTSHVEILDVCLAGMAADGTIRPLVSDLTTDGDNSDCEAIFKAENEYYILKVR